MRKFFSLIIVLGISGAVCGAAQKADEYNIMNYGAKADTTFLSTKAIQKAIDICAGNGGGKVIIPAGNFKTGSIFLKDNVYLYLNPGAALYGSTNIKDYIPVQPKYLSLRTWVPTVQLIYGENITNSGIMGEGTIDGQGNHFIKKKDKDEGIDRPHLIRFVSSTKITVKDVKLRNSGCWMQHYLACDELILSNLNIYNRATANNDAVDIDGCHNVIVNGLFCDSDDDGITLKSTSPRLCENVIVSDCVVSSHCNGIKLGTETNGGFRNITINNCIIKPSEDQSHKIFGYTEGLGGIALEIVDGGILENVQVSNINITGTTAPIFIRLGDRRRPYAENVPVTVTGEIKDITISNIRAKGASSTGCSITGLPGHPVRNVLLKDIYIEFEGGVDESDIVYEPKELAENYPESNMFGILPAYGFYIRHASGIRFENVNLSTAAPDPRPATVMTDCSSVSTTDN